MKGNEKLLPWQRQAVIDASLAGEKHAAIGAEFGVTPQYVGQLVKKHLGRPGRASGRPRKRKEAIRRMLPCQYRLSPVIG